MQTSPTAIPVYPGRNFAPLQPLLSLQTDAKRPNKFKDALKERKQHYDRVDARAWEEVYRAGQMVDLFCQGKQIVKRDPYNGTLSALSPLNDDDTMMRVMNIMQFYETSCIEKDLSSNPDILIEAGKYTEQARAAAHGATTIYKHYSDKFWTEEFAQRDARLAFRFGTAVDRLRYDPGAEGIIVYQELAQQRTISLGDGYGTCGECEYFGLPQEFVGAVDEMPGTQSCPQCGSPAVNVIPPASGDLSSVTDVQKVQMGDLVLECLPLAGCKWDMPFLPEASSWFQYKQAVNLSAVKAILGPIAIKGGMDVDDAGLRILKNLGLTGQAMFGRSNQWRNGTETETQQAVITELYMSQGDYGDIPIQSEDTLGGGELQEGPLTNSFPNGMVTVWLGSDILLGVYEGSHKTELVSRPWFMRPLTGVGRGAQDMVEVQKRYNTLDSQQVAYWSSVATPAIIYDQDLMQGDEIDYLGHPRMSVPADTSRMARDNRTIRDAVWQFQPAPIPNALIQYTYDHLNNAMQLAAHVTTFSGGLPGVNNNTATGAQITQSNADAIWIPTLKLKGAARQRLAQLTIPKYQQHFPMEREFQLGGDYSRAQMIAVRGADLDVDLRYTVVPNSEEPNSPYTRKANISAVFQLANGAAGLSQLKQSDPALYNSMLRIWDIELDDTAENASHVEQITAQRIEQIRQAATSGQLGDILTAQVQMPMDAGMDPMVAQMMQQQMQEQLLQMQQQAVQSVLRPPVSQFEGAQDAKAKYCQLWLDTDQGQQSDPTTRSAVEQLIVLHFQNAGNQAQHIALAEGTVQAVGAAPSQLADLAGQHLAPQPEKPAPGALGSKAPRPKPKKEGTE